MVIINKNYKNVTKKSLYIDNQGLYRDLKNAIEEIKDKNYKNNKIENELLLLKEEYNKLLHNQSLLENLFDKIGIINYDDIYNFIFELYNFKNKHICVFHPDDVEQDLYDKVYDQIKDEIREDLLNELNYNKNNKLIGNIKEDITSDDNSSILNENIKQDTHDENIVDEVLETEIKNNNKSKENIDRKTIIVDDIVDGAFETNINEDVVEDILITTPVISNNNKSTPIENIYDFFEKDEKHKVIILNNNDTNTKDKNFQKNL